MHPFRRYINEFVRIPDEDWAQVEVCLEKRQVPAETVLLEEGQICRELYFLEKGLVRFYVWKNGNDVTKFFTQPPYCFTSQRSLSQQIPAKENIATLEESLIWVMPQEEALSLLSLPSWSAFIRMLIQEVQGNTEDILEDLQNTTAEDRYIHMLEHQRELVQRVPLKHLASYLGIAPQSLSRIRRKLASS